MKFHNIQILLLRLAIGAFFLHLGMDKINEGWLHNAVPLQEDLTEYQKTATGYQLIYLDRVALPYVDIWAKSIAAGEAALGVSLLLGLVSRLSSALGLLMVLNLHAATGKLFSLAFFASSSAALLVAALFAVMFAGGGRWVGIDQRLAKSYPRNILW